MFLLLAYIMPFPVPQESKISDLLKYNYSLYTKNLKACPLEYNKEISCFIAFLLLFNFYE